MKLSILAACCLAPGLLPFLPHRPDAPAAAEETLPVAVIGASLAAGASEMLGAVPTDDSEAFADIYQYPDVLAALEPSWEIENLGDTWFFGDAETMGDKQIETALDLGSELVLALDFLFWFAFTALPDEERVDYLEREGFGRLEQLWDGMDAGQRPTVLIGLLPDVRDTPVIPAAQKPGDEAFAALNERIAAWATQHANVHVVPMAEKLERLRGGEELQVCATRYAEPDLPSIFLTDRLHPSTRGSALVAGMCLETLAGLSAQPRAAGGELEPRVALPMATKVAELDLRKLAEHLIAKRRTAAEPVESGSPR